MKQDFVWAKDKTLRKVKAGVTIGFQMSIPQDFMERIEVSDTDRIDIGFDDANHLVGIRKGMTFSVKQQERRFMIRSRKNVDKAKKLVGRNPFCTIQDGIIILHKSEAQK